MDQTRRPDDTQLWRMAREDREEALGFLRELSDEQLDLPSLCEGWRVRDVAVHLLVDTPSRELGWPQFVARFLGLGLSVSKANAWWVARNRDRPTASLLEAFERELTPGPFTRLLGAGTALRATVIHQQDMRRPLGLARAIPEARLRAVLGVVLTRKGSINLGADRRSAGLRLRATDFDWSCGQGPEVAGPAEALVMALAGRQAALADLSGPGLVPLSGRMA
jgi:uncharacterized protein (TIGR03083 family)